MKDNNYSGTGVPVETDIFCDASHDVVSEGEQLSSAISGTNLFSKYERTEAQLSALITASRNLFKKRSFDHLAKSIFDLARPAIGATTGFIATIDEGISKPQMISVDAGKHAAHNAVKETSRLLELCIPLLRKKKAFFNNDFQSSEWDQVLSHGPLKINNLLACPLVLRKKTEGIMVMMNKPGGFDENDLNITQTFCQLMAISLANTRSWETIKESEHRFRQFFNNEPNFCLIISPDGLILDANTACLSMMECDREGLMNKPWWTIFDKQSQKQAESKLPVHFNNKEMQLCSSSGNHYHVLVTASITRDEEGELLHYVTVLNDITKRVMVEKEQQRLLNNYQNQSRILVDANAQLEAALIQVCDSEKKLQKLYDDEKKLKDELEAEIKKRADFTHTLVHELKTPLVPLVASSSLLSDGLIDEPWQSIAQNIERGAMNLSHRIEELLDVAKGEAGVLSVELSEVNPLLLLQEVTGELRDLISVRHQKIELDFPGETPNIKADPVRLRQVLTNIFNNAVKYTPEGGEIAISATVKGDNLAIAVHDTGLGIPPEDMSQIFQSYYRASNSRFQYHGMGVGLFLSKKIMELHGGDITVASEEGKGSVFTIIVPVSVTGAASAFKNNNEQSVILVADSDKATIDEITAHLKNMWPGIGVVPADKGQTTIELCRREKIDGLVLGLEFPDIDGLEVLRAIRGFNNVPVVLVSSQPREDVRDACLALGITAYYVKPINADVVIQQLKTRMDHRKQYSKR